jgi:hypothetical protein
LAQPLSLFWNGVMHPSPQFNLYFPQFRPHPVSARFPFELESTLAVLPADVSESEEVKGFRFARPAFSAICRSKAAKLKQTSLFRVK